MYTYVTIRFSDDSPVETIIKSDHTIDEHDDLIFFYGMSREDIIHAYVTGELCENEWQIVEVGETVDSIA